MTAWTVIVAIGGGSYAMRAAMLVLVGVRPLPPRVDRALRHVGPAAIAALIAAMVFTRAGAVHPLPTAELAAIVAGFLVVRRTGNVVHAIVLGMPTMWLLAALTP
jgi:branched-subunit amino acid transport protein